MSFGIALSGINAAQADLAATSNNIANANTTGFKSSMAEFGDMFQNSAYGLSATAIGSGVQLERVAQNFGQGSVNVTNNSLDMALSGTGFFTMKDNGAIVYTRAGNFSTDQNGYVVNATGQKLQVFPPIAGTSTFNTGSMTNLQLSTANNPPAATTSMSGQINLPSGATAPTTTTFSATDPTSYNQTTSATIYDSLGAAHNASFYFVAGATPNNWTMYTAVDGNVLSGSAALQYSSSGALITPANGQVTLPGFSPAAGAATMNITLDMSKSTQFGSQFGVSALSQNGYATGQLTGISTDSTGVILARYTNGQTQALGQLALTNFSNPQGLQQLGNASWGQTFASGQPLVGTAGSTNFGQVQSGALESSNVDLTAQLVNMITAQRDYQANAQSITTENQLTQTIIAAVK